MHVIGLTIKNCFFFALKIEFLTKLVKNWQVFKLQLTKRPLKINIISGLTFFRKINWMFVQENLYSFNDKISLLKGMLY